MDYFDSNFKNSQFDGQDELPEDFSWDSMKDGVYYKMDKAKPAKSRRYWPLFLLLFLAGCGTGSWLASSYFNNKSLSESAIVFDPIEKKEIKKESNRTAQADAETTEEVKLENGTTETKQDQGIIRSANKSISNNKNTSSLFVEYAVAKANENAKSIITKTITPAGITTENEIGEITKPLKENTIPNFVVNSSPATDSTWNKIEGLPTLFVTQFEQPTSGEYPFAFQDVPRLKAPMYKKYIELSVVGGVVNWTAMGANNINHDHVSGYPGYSFNPSLSLFIKENQAIQLDYEYAAFEELFDYDGSHDIEVSKEDEVVKEIINSLTGEVISTERRNVIASGKRSYREVKYNQYKLHTLSIGYRLTKNISNKSSCGLYTGGSYLLALKGKGKRLDENLDVITFDEENPLFEKGQFGLRLGISYDYKIGSNSSLYSQIMATKYLTNWEVDASKSTTRPLLYGIQIGFRRQL